MKKTNLILVIVLALLLPLAATAQKGKKAAPPRKKAPTTVVEEEEENPLMEQMLTAVERVVFVDSVVVAKSQVLSALFPNPEEGRLTTYADFFNSKNATGGYVYVNELGNHCIFSKTDSRGHTWLYSSDLLGGQWSEPEKLKGLDAQQFQELNYPYLMSDGVTLYFAARGEGSLGGYDIYRTRLNTETGRYLKPENIGMPFCSEADDFFYIIDEQNRLGYFATSRRQPNGKVCVYTFVPNETRNVYNTETMNEERIKSLARINRIADTWDKGSTRKEALARMSSRRTQSTASQQQTAGQGNIAFIINDQTTYTKLSDFKNPALFREWQELQSKVQELETSLQRMRNTYAQASTNEKLKLRSEILTCEQRLLTMQEVMRQKEKEIRRTENSKQ